MEPSRLRALKRHHVERLLQSYPGVVGVGVSEKVKDGVPQGTMAVTIYVRKKIPPERLAAHQRADRDPALVRELEALSDVDVKELGEISALVGERERPVKGGLSEGHPDITAGTGALLVRDQVSGELLRVSNNHVYANVNRGRPGDPILQPGAHDGGQVGRDTVGVLRRFAAILLGAGAANEVDCAVRSLVEEERYSIKYLGAPRALMTAVVGQTVTKSGRTTGVTKGRIADVSLDLEVGYGADGQVWFVDQILVESAERFSQGGDSGSAVLLYDPVTGEWYWVGLLFAGSQDGRQTICNHAERVAAALGVSVPEPDEEDPEQPPPPSPPPGEERPGCLGGLLGKVFGR